MFGMLPVEVDITNGVLSSSTAASLTGVAAYSGATNYSKGTLSKAVDETGSDVGVWQSLQDNNLGRTPAVSPLWWQFIGYEEPGYAGGTTYALNQKTDYLDRMYNSLSAGNIGHTPLTSPTYWEDIGPTNKWAMFDYTKNKITTGAATLVAVLTPAERMDTIGIVNIDADSVRCQVSVSGIGTTFDQTIQLSDHGYISNWYQYFTTAFTQKTTALFQNIPRIANSIVTLTFTKSSGNARSGSLTMGSQVDVGKIQYGADDDAVNFSTINRTFDGEADLVQRRSIPKTTQTTWINVAQIPSVRKLRDISNATPMLWVGLPDTDNPYFDSFILVGIARQFKVNATYVDKAVVTLELEGL